MNELERKGKMKEFICSYCKNNPDIVTENTGKMLECILEKLPVYEFSVYLTPENFKGLDKVFIEKSSEYARRITIATDEDAKKNIISSFIKGYYIEDGMRKYTACLNYLLSALEAAPSITDFWRWCECYLRDVPSCGIEWEDELIRPYLGENESARLKSALVGVTIRGGIPQFVEDLCDYCKAFIH